MTRHPLPLERALFIGAGLLITGYLLKSEKFLFFALLVSSIFLLGWGWQKYALTNFEYHRRFSETRAFVGETIAVTLSVANRKLLPLPFLKIDDYFSADLRFSDLKPETSHIPGLSFTRQYFALSWFEKTSRTYHIQCRQRGLYTFSHLRVEVGDPFGLFPQQVEITQPDRLIIYPQVKPITGLDFLAKELYGDWLADRRLLEDPVYFRGVRPYQPQDDLRHVHWKATARTNTLQTRIFEPTTAPTVMLFVNIATFSKRWQGVDPVQLERLVSVAASLCAYGVDCRLMMGLSANGTYYHSDQPLRVLPSRSPDQLTRLLEALAGIRGFAGSEFEDFLLHDSARLPWGSTLVVITSLVKPELQAVILRLKAAGRKLVLLSLAETPPARIPNVVSYHLAASEAKEESYHFTPVEFSVAEPMQETLS